MDKTAFSVSVMVFTAVVAAPALAYERVPITQPQAVVRLSDPELARITGGAVNPVFRRTTTELAASDSASYFQQVATVSRVMFDNWLNDVATPLIANNLLAAR